MSDAIDNQPLATTVVRCNRQHANFAADCQMQSTILDRRPTLHLSQTQDGEEPMASIIHRPTYEDVIRRHLDTSEIKILTGVRRCGKSTLLEGLAESLRARDGGPNVLYLRLDAFGMPLSPTAEWLQGQIEQAAGKADPARTFHVLLDEVQEIPAWEKVVRQLRTRPRTDTWVTGSNAHVLSSDLSTLIGGRYVQIPVYPLSFAEYRDFCHGRADAPTGEDALFAAYMRTGGMPGQFELPTRSDESLEEMLSALCDTVLINDVARHARISDVDLLTKLTRYVFSTSGNLFSTRSIARALASAGRKTSPETVDAYVDALAKAYVHYTVRAAGRCRQGRAKAAAQALSGRQRPAQPHDGVLAARHRVSAGVRRLQRAEATRSRRARRGHAHR